MHSVSLQMSAYLEMPEHFYASVSTTNYFTQTESRVPGAAVPKLSACCPSLRGRSRQSRLHGAPHKPAASSAAGVQGRGACALPADRAAGPSTDAGHCARLERGRRRARLCSIRPGIRCPRNLMMYRDVDHNQYITRQQCRVATEMMAKHRGDPQRSDRALRLPVAVARCRTTAR
jgi:hypothetical protein